MRPINDKVLVKILDKKQIHSTLIILDKQTAVETCEVLAIARNDSEIKAGDKVLVHREHMLSIENGVLVDRKNILAVLED